jgi:hypothetical protein
MVENLPADGFLIEKGAIRTLEVFHNEVAISPFNASVPSRGGGIFENNMVLLRSTNESGLGIALILLPSISAGDDDELPDSMLLRGFL